MRIVKYSRWANSEGVSGDDARADSLTDLKTTGDALSVYLVPRDRAAELAPRVAVAFAGTRSEIDHCEYFLFDAQLLEQVPIGLTGQLGRTADDVVNGLHADVVNLTARSLARLTALLLHTEKELGRVLKRDLRARLLDGVEKGWLVRDRLNKTLLKELSLQDDGV